MNATNNESFTINRDVVDNSMDTAPVPVILRRDAASNPVVFIQNSLDLSKDGGVISVWHVGKRREASVVPLSYYYATTRLDETSASHLENKFAEGWMPKFGLNIRHRLGKNLEHRPDHPAHNKSAASTVQKAEKPFNKELYMEKLQMALEASIRAAFKIVAEEMEMH